MSCDHVCIGVRFLQVSICWVGMPAYTYTLDSTIDEPMTLAVQTSWGSNIHSYVCTCIPSRYLHTCPSDKYLHMKRSAYSCAYYSHLQSARRPGLILRRQGREAHDGLEDGRAQAEALERARFGLLDLPWLHRDISGPFNTGMRCPYADLYRLPNKSLSRACMSSPRMASGVSEVCVVENTAG